MERANSHIGYKAAPVWLLNSKDHITSSKEWNVFVSEMHDTIQQQLGQSHVKQFTDLSESEKQLFMERAAKALEKGTAFRNLYSQTVTVLDQQLNADVARQLLEEYPINTKTDLLLECAKDGAVSILRKWPDFKTKLHLCLNQALPDTLREITWKLFLDNPRIRKQYVDLLAHNPRAAISSKDFDISQTCEQVMASHPTFADIQGSIGVFYAMKAVLSYYHAQLKTDKNLSDIDYLLFIPFAIVSVAKIPRREPASSQIVALLVEEYLTFMQSRPTFMSDLTDQRKEQPSEDSVSFARYVAQAITTHDPELARVLSEMPIPEPTPPPSPESEMSVHLPTDEEKTDDEDDDDETIGTATDTDTARSKPEKVPESPAADKKKEAAKKKEAEKKEAERKEAEKKEAAKKEAEKKAAKGKDAATKKDRKSPGADSFTADGQSPVLADIILYLLRPLMRSLFVGYANMNTVLFCWDQYMISLDSPGFHDQIIPALCSSFLMQLSERLRECNSLVEMDQVMRADGPKIKKEHLQYLINRYFYQDLYDMLNQDKAALPVVDPTQAKKGWLNWSKEDVPSRIRPSDKRSLRQHREDERQRAFQKQKEEERKQAEERERIRREEAEEKRRLEREEQERILEERRREEEEKLYVEALLKQERQKRLETEKEANTEITRLQDEVKELKKLIRRGPDASRDHSPRQSLGSMDSQLSQYPVPPPPSLKSHEDSSSEKLASAPLTPISTSHIDSADKAVHELLVRIADSTNRIAHSEEYEKRLLDDCTRANVVKLQEDQRDAEVLVLGRPLIPGELGDMDDDDREEVEAKLRKAHSEAYVDRKRKEAEDH